MTAPSFGRIRDLNGLPELIVHLAGDDGLENAFARQSLPLELLDTPEAIIPMRDLIALYRNAAEVCGMRSFGLAAAVGIEFENYGAWGNFIVQAPTLRQALRRFQIALPYYETGSRLTMREFGDEFVIGYENTYQNLSGYRHAGDMVLRVIEALIRDYLGTHWIPLKVSICGIPGPWEQDYEDAFSAAVAFSDDGLELVVDRELVDQSRKSAEAGLGEFVSIADLQRVGTDLPTDFLDGVAHLISLRLPAGGFGLEDIAESLALGPRTVQRRLEEYGMNYRALVTKCRMQRARELLTGTQANIEQVGRELGYSGISQFTRAFINAHGVPPSKFQHMHSQMRSPEKTGPHL